MRKKERNSKIKVRFLRELDMYCRLSPEVVCHNVIGKRTTGKGYVFIKDTAPGFYI